MNVIFIVIDTLRADRLGCYGYFRDTSPTIDRLAAEGILFKNYFASAISTGAAFTCLFTGLEAINHGFYATPAHRPNLMNFDDTIPTLPEIIQSNSDYITAAFDNLINFAGHMKQTVRGFEYYINVTRDGGFPHPEYTAGELNERFLPWLRSHRDEKFFAFLHFWDPHHHPYRAPGFRHRFLHVPGSLEGFPVKTAPAGYEYVPGWGRVGEIVDSIAPSIDVDGGAGKVCESNSATSVTQDLYDCSIAYVDHEIARVLDLLCEESILDDTTIVLTADHGEDLGIHGVWGHGLLHDTVIRIPLILWRPGLLPTGMEAEEFAQHVDVAPTLLDIMDISPNARPVIYSQRYIYRRFQPTYRDMDGRSLLPRVRRTEQGPNGIVAEVRRGPCDPGYRALMKGPWKLIVSLAGERQLYDRCWDPLEKINLNEQYSDKSKEMAEELEAWVQSHIGEGGLDPMRVYETSMS